MTVRARRAPVDLAPVLQAVTNDWEPGRVIAERAGIDPKTGGPRLAALVCEGNVEFTHSDQLDVRVYRLARASTEVAILEPVAVDITPVSWTPVEPMSFEDWSAAGANLQSIARSVNWLVGDWLAYGEKQYGETYTQAIEATGLEVQSLMNIASVARRVNPASRRRELSWSHHEAVASLEPAEQDQWLQEAEREGYTVKRLRSRLAGVAKDAPDPDQQLAPTHIGRLTIKFVAESDDHAHQKVKELAALLERKGVSVSHKTASPL